MFVAKKCRYPCKDQVFVTASDPYKSCFQIKDEKMSEFSTFIRVFSDVTDFPNIKPCLATS